MIVVSARFAGAEAVWRSLSEAGGRPDLPASLPEGRRAALRERFCAGLPAARDDGAITPSARAWTVQGRRP